MREVLFFEEGVHFPNFFSEQNIRNWIFAIGKHYSKEIGELSFIFCNDDYILNINRDYLNHDYFTDVITFDYSEQNILSGDVFISLDTVKSNASLYKVTYEEEFHRVIAHSILHLIGFKDKTAEESTEMRENENVCLELLKSLNGGEIIA